jgi:hypothetical protein
MNELQHFGILGMKWGIRRYQNKDGSLTPAGKKKDLKEVDKEIKKRNADLFVKSNNYAADRINGKWIDDFNKKWEDAFKGYDDWQSSPNYSKYENEYMKNLSFLMNASLHNNPNSVIRTKLGSTYTARYLEQSGGIKWATQKEWDQYDKK